MFTKGTKVRVKTTNGGEVVGVLGETVTTEVVFEQVFGSYGVFSTVVSSDKVKKIEVMS